MGEIRWIKTGKTETEEGATITYSGEGTHFTIESRKRHIPHSKTSYKGGTWDYTSYHVLNDGKELVKRHALKEAKKYAERLHFEGMHREVAL